MFRPTPTRNSQRGFTLAEILVTTAIFAVIMMAALAVYDQSNKVFKKSSEAADLQQSTRVGYDKLMSEVRMLGFDYSRGGVPSRDGQYAQPDEQIEYAGVNVIAFRSNFDYVTNAANGNGLAPAAYTKINPKINLPYFPYITTTNEEIVIYALRSADASKNNGTVSFYVDSSIPRSGYPGGSAERMVKLTDIDTTNDNPPYTLFRMTVSDVLNGNPGTPIADNLRSLNFSYFTDMKGTSPLKESNGTDITAARNADGSTVTVPAGSGAIGGAGQYDPNNIGATPNFNDRLRREIISSLRVSLVGINSQPEANFQNPTETNPAFKSYREYQLQALVVPRNLGLTGFPEPNSTPPGPPTIEGICTGFCGAPVICWSPPTTGGPVEKYTIAWDTNPVGAFTSQIDIYDAAATSAIVPDDGISDVAVPRTYKMLARNDATGTSLTWSNSMTVTPRESTKPQLNAAAALAATDVGLGNAQDNQVVLSWKVPTLNTPPTSTLSCVGTCGASGANLPAIEETRLWEVWRSTDPATLGIKVLSITSPTRQPTAALPGAMVTWADSTALSEVPPAACVQYYYRIRLASRCAKNDSWNVPGSAGSAAAFMSDIYPPLLPGVPNGIPGSATSSATPAAPIGLAADPSASSCPPSNGDCTIVLNWSKVTTDTTGMALQVDTYRVTRNRKRLTDPDFTPDPTFPPLDVGGFSQDPSGIASWTDKKAPAFDSCGKCTGLPWYYQYTVAAKVCSTYGAESNPAEYPTPCAINPVIVQHGGTAASGSGTTPQTAWIFNSGDTIEVSPPSGGTLDHVRFVVTAYPSGAFIDDVTIKPANAAPSTFVYTWGNFAQGTYRVVILATNPSGCTEVNVRYVTEQPPAPCAFTPISVPPVNVVKSQSNETATMDFQFQNGAGEPMKFFMTSPIAFTGSTFVNWQDPDTKHPDLTFTQIQYSFPSGQSTDSFTIPSNGNGVGNSVLNTTRPMPSNTADLAASGKMTLRLSWLYNGGNGAKADPKLTLSPVNKLCISYQILSEPGTTKFCNVIGQSATTNNPNACD